MADFFGNAVRVADFTDPHNQLKVNPDGSINITGTVILDVSTVEVGQVVIKDDITANTAAVDSAGRLAVDGSGVTQPVSAVSLPLPSGAATSDNQTATISTLGNISTAINLQAKLSDTQPVSIASPVAVTGTFFQDTQPISGAISFTVPQHVILDSGSATISGAVTVTSGNVTLLAGSAVIGHVIVDSGAITATVASTTITSGNIAVSNFPASQAVTVTSGNITAAVSGAVTITSGNITVLNSSFAVTGPLTDIQLRASAVPVSLTEIPDGNVTVLNSSFAVTGPLTDAELRASPVEITGTIAASSAATATVNDPTYTEGDDTAAFSQDLTGHLRTLASATVSDNPTSPLDGIVVPLSVTKQGRLRVAVVEEQIGVSFTQIDEAAMWGTLQTNYTFTGSPWGDW